MKSLDLSQIKNDFYSFFQQIQDLISDNNRFRELIADYIDCRHTVDELINKNDKKSKILLREYLAVQNELEAEIYSELKKNNSNKIGKIKGSI